MSTGWDSPQVKGAEIVFPEKLRVFLCLQLMLLRRAFSELLNSTADITVIGDSDEVKLIMAPSQLTADVFVVDADLVKFDFEKTLKLLTGKAGVVLIFQKQPKSELLRLAVRSGVCGYVCGASSPEALYAAIRAAAINQVHLDPLLVDSLVVIVQQAEGKSGRGKKAVNKENTALGPREKEVLRMVTLGFTNSEIAEKLGISVKTVDSHRYRAMGKLNLRSRAEAVAYGLQVGWLNSE